MLTPRMDLHAHIAPHCTFGEAVTTEHVEFLAEQESPPDDIFENLHGFTNGLFEQARSVVGVGWHVNSMYRCPALNAALPGHSKTSNHMRGLAGDLLPMGLPLFDAFQKLHAAIEAGDLPADQLIWEYGRWIHLGDKLEGLPAPRRQVLMIFVPERFDGQGNRVPLTGYLPFNPLDPRLPVHS